jgi:hypothetical protein
MHFMKRLVLTLSVCSAASAGIIQANFNETLDLPFFATGARVEQLNAVSLPSAPPQLTAADIVTNPSSWQNSLNVSFDPVTDILSLTGDGDNDYQIISVTLSSLLFNVAGQHVVGIVPISTGNAVFMSGTDPFTTTTNFTANSFGVTYSVASFATFPPEFLIGTGTDTFQVQLASGVPEPGTLGFTGLGAALLLVAAGRARAAKRAAHHQAAA